MDACCTETLETDTQWMFDSVVTKVVRSHNIRFGGERRVFLNNFIQPVDTSGGFELGSGPSIVILDTGGARALTTSTIQSDIYAVFFDQKGLMAGLGLQGSKISRLEK